MGCISISFMTIIMGFCCKGKKYFLNGRKKNMLKFINKVDFFLKDIYYYKQCEVLIQNKRGRFFRQYNI